VQSSTEGDGHDVDGGTLVNGTETGVAPTGSDVPDPVQPTPASSGSGTSGTNVPPIDEETGVFPDGTPVPSELPGVEPEACDAEASVSALTKLSTAQYRNTVRDLVEQIGAGSLVADLEPTLMGIPDDSRGELFSGLDSRVALEHVQGYYQVAKQVADGVVGNDELLVAVASDCAADEVLTDVCLRDFVDDFGMLAFRHPLTDEERSALILQGESGESATEQIRAVILAALMSPRFVHLVEVDGAWIGGASAMLQLSPYEVVSRLSYTFWETMPDRELFEAAKDGSVLTADGSRRVLDHVMDDPRAKETLWKFWREWLALDNFTGFEFGRPGFQALVADLDVDDNLYQDMTAEVRALTEEFTFNQAGTLRDLIETNVSVTQSAQLANVYGVEPWSGEGDFPTFTREQRSGLFQRSALLVSSLEQTNPFHRGAFVKRYLLCEPLPAPDPAALPPGSLDIPPTSDVETTRQRFENKVEGNGLCTGCHGLFSSVGYALEAYDSLGRHRTTELVFDEATGDLRAELPVDVTASVTVGGETRTVGSPAELNSLMVDAGQLESCLAQQYFKFVNRRQLAVNTSDVCVRQEVVQATEAAGLRAGFRRIAELSNFYQRKVGDQ
jgi:hypothetical protein